MSGVDRLCDGLLQFAVRRWPADLRAELARAWVSELAALRDDPNLSRSRRAYGRVAFALSLAVSRPVEPLGEPAGLRWRDLASHAPGLLAWLVAPLVGARLIMAAATSAGTVARLSGLRGFPATDTAAAVTSGLGLLVGFAVVALIGRGLARSWPLDRGRSGMVAPVAALAAGAVLGAYVTHAVVTRVDERGWSRADLATCGAGVAIWLVLGTALIALTRRLAGPSGPNPVRSRWRRTSSTVLGGVMALIVADVAVAGACLPLLIRAGTNPVWGFGWLPLSVIPERPAITLVPDLGGLIGNASLGSLALLLCAATALALGYGVTRPRLIRATPVPAVPAATPALAVAVSAAPSGLRRAGLCCAGLGLAVWVPALAVVTPAQVTRTETQWSKDQASYLTWAHDLRQTAVVLLVLGALAATACLRHAVSAAVGATVLLLGVDIILDVHRIGGVAAALVSGLAGLAVIGASWWVTRLPASRADGRAQYRRVLAGAAIVAGYCGPTMLVRGGWTPPANEPVPAGLAEATTVVVAALAALAICLAAATREAPMRRSRSRALVAAGAVLAGGLSYFAGGSVAVGLGPAFAVALLALARGRPDDRSRWRFAAGWGLAGVVATLAAIPLLIASVILPSVVVGDVDLGGDHSGEALAALPGAVLVGVLLALPAARLAIRRGAEAGAPRGENAGRRGADHATGLLAGARHRSPRRVGLGLAGRHDVRGATDVGGPGPLRIVDRGRRDHRGEVDHRVDTGARPGHRHRTGDVAPHGLDARLLSRAPVGRGEPGEAADLMSPAEQFGKRVRADVAEGTGQQDRHQRCLGGGGQCRAVGQVAGEPVAGTSGGGRSRPTTLATVSTSSSRTRTR